MDLLLVEDNATDRMVIQARLQHAFPSAADRGGRRPARLQRASQARRLRCRYHRLLARLERRLVGDAARARAMAAGRVIMLTGNGGEEVVAGAFKYGLYHYLLKPDGFDELASVTSAAMESKRREESYELMAMIVNSIPDGVHCVDAAGTITAINAAAHRMYGYADFEIVGRTNAILLPAAQARRNPPPARAGAWRRNRAAISDPAGAQRRRRNCRRDDDTADARRRRRRIGRGVYRHPNRQTDSAGSPARAMSPMRRGTR